MRKEDLYQILLILSGVLVTALFGVFLYREIFPEYKIYQQDYVNLEAFRSSLTNEPPPAFQYGIKQIVLEREDKGPAIIDRCTTCHVALQIPYFSPTKITHDSNGKSVLVPNENYIWKKLNEKIAALRDEKVLENLTKKEAAEQLKLAADYEALKVARVGDYVYDVTKVLSMHPLMGNETYPFEFHPVEEYGCTSCHSGNGRSIVTDRAHGPVFDGKYEIEELGHTLKFTESDPENDPPFAHVFNHKPGESLIFQTEPLFVGPLIQAKCVQCHQNSTLSFEVKAVSKNVESDVDKLTRDYQTGMDLYISQACYACHRIAGFARGGVGPELTLAGNSYPWYLKRKLVWPQGDLPTSTMPNMRFDHAILQDLMLFLLAQKGGNSSVSQTAYKAALLAWEGGKKLPWETPVPPSKMTDISSSMTIFATEGCAACHRLQGFESNIGFAVEKRPHTFKEFYDEQRWFRQLFPEVVHITLYDEELPGSDIVSTLERHAKEIDEKIVSDVRQKGLLEQIDQSHPGVIESYYSPFMYAVRARDHHYQTLLEQNPLHAAALQAEWEAWKERVHRVLMMHIQTYGLGRLIGPHLNWSGIYRTDEWLMEHFRNPTSHVPRSLMPVFPFDDTKFYALTYMLDQLAIRNRNALRQIWSQVGFDPLEAFNMLCAQCHGIDRVGNGAIAEWIYPIPKNLRNADFLRNLTKEKTIYSILHGVHGTPMPPWGDAAPHKPEEIQKASHDIPVMNPAEVEYLVNWMFSSLPGGEVIRQTEDVPKWKYTSEDILKELTSEGGKLQPEDEIFQVVNRPTDTGDNSYFIKKKFYTPQNIEAGKAFFLINCAVCHGTEADGNSIRAGVMQEAKPRILTNLDWIGSRDDLRLLRSIKYGVPGTSMTPWGDLTSSLQRLQLVIFIRSLSAQQEKREKLMTAIYQVFDEDQFLIESARIANSKEIEILKSEQLILKEKTDAAKIDEAEIKNAVQDYQQLLEISQKVAQLEKEDQKYLALEETLKSERNLYMNLGVALIAKEVSDETFQTYLDLIQLNDHRYTLTDQQLKFKQDPQTIDQIQALRKKIIAQLESKSSEPLEIESYKKLRDKFTTETEQALKLAEKQKM